MDRQKKNNNLTWNNKKNPDERDYPLLYITSHNVIDQAYKKRFYVRP